MDTGSFNNKDDEPIGYELFKVICEMSGVTRDWERNLAYKVYLEMQKGNAKKANLILYYNSLYFNRGSFN